MGKTRLQPVKQVRDGLGLAAGWLEGGLKFKACGTHVPRRIGGPSGDIHRGESAPITFRLIDRDELQH